MKRTILAALLAASIVTPLSIHNAEAKGWAWFVHNIKPGNQCPGSPVATTYYGEGRRNADGSRFDPNGHSAASMHYPFGTVLLVTNCSNGQSVHVTVKDRGPGAYQRALGIKLDISTGAARAIHLGQNGRFESGYTSIQVVSGGDGNGNPITASRRRNHRDKNSIETALEIRRWNSP